MNTLAATTAEQTRNGNGGSRCVQRLVRPLNGQSRQLWQRSILGAWILREEHDTLCGCSYCRELNCSIGLTLPECKARHSWRVLSWVRNNKLQVLRWTLPNFWPNAEVSEGGTRDSRIETAAQSRPSLH